MHRLLALSLFLLAGLSFFPSGAHAFSLFLNPGVDTIFIPLGQSSFPFSVHVNLATEDDHCTLTGGGLSENFNRNNLHTYSVNITITTTFELECFDAGGASLGRQSKTVTVLPTPPKVTLTASVTPPELPVGGGQVVLAWEAPNANECFLNAIDSSGPILNRVMLPTTGSRDFTLTRPTHFELLCQNESASRIATSILGLPGQANYVVLKSFNVTVDTGSTTALPSISFQASPNSFNTTDGGQLTLLWSVNDNGVLPHSTCRAVDWTDSGSQTLDPDGPFDTTYPQLHRSSPQTVTAPRTFTMECTNRNGTSQRTVPIHFIVQDGTQCTSLPGGVCQRVSQPCAAPLVPSVGVCPGTGYICCATGTGGPPGNTGNTNPPGNTGNTSPPGNTGNTSPPGNTGPSTPPDPIPSSPIVFTPLTSYTTVDAFLLGTLGWLQGIVGMLALIFIVIGGFLYVTSGGDSGRVETAKKCITAAVIGLALALAAPSFLREISSILGWNNTGPTPPGTSLSLLQIIKNVLDFLLSIVGVVGLIMLVIGGIMYMTSTGDEDRIDTGKSIVKYSLIGIFVALAGLVIVSQVAKFFT